MSMIKPSDLPAPDAVIDYGGGCIGPLMFHYLTEGEDWTAVCQQEGFEWLLVTLSDDFERQQYRPLLEAYENGDIDEVLRGWEPSAQGDGWKLVSKGDTEDGPTAIFIRPTQDASAIKAQSSPPDTK